MMIPKGKACPVRPAGELEPRRRGYSLLWRRLVLGSVDESQVVPAKWTPLTQLALVLGSRLTEFGKSTICSNFQVLP